jgi:cell division protein FtsI/penicillin-binding protein 2
MASTANGSGGEREHEPRPEAQAQRGEASFFARWRRGLVPTRPDAIALSLVVVMTLALGVMLWRVWQLQARPDPRLLAFKGERTSTLAEQAPRGMLTDRRGRPLAVTTFGKRLFIDPLRFPAPAGDAKSELASSEAMTKVAQVTGVPIEKFGPKLLGMMAQNQRKLAAYAAALKGAGADAGLVDPPEAPVPEDQQPSASALAVIDAQTREAERTAAASLGIVLAEEPVVAGGAGGAGVTPGSAAGLVADGAAGPGVVRKPRLARYLPVGDVLDESKVEMARGLKIPGVHLEDRPVREAVAPELAGALLGKTSPDAAGVARGLMGTEKRFDERLQAAGGRFEYVRDARGRPLWAYPESYTPAEAGDSQALSIDLELQRIVTEELTRGVDEANAAGGRAVLMDPNTGEVLAMVDLIREPAGLVDYDWQTVIPKDNLGHGKRYRTIRPDPGRLIHPAMGRNRCVEDIYEPGSTFKPFMWAAVTELGLVRPKDTFDTGGGSWRTPYGRTVTDVQRRGTQTWEEVLINSSNIGMAKGTSKLSFEQMHAAVKKFGFGSRPGTGLPGETPGLVTPLERWSVYTHTSVAMGHEVAVTPVQVVRAFSVFARRGAANGTLPDVRLTGWDSRGEPSALDVTTRVLPRGVADVTRETMRGVTAVLDRRMHERNPMETGWRYELFGKSGTAEIPLGQAPEGMARPKGSDGYFSGQYNSSFVAGGPAHDPRLVMIAVIDDPGPELVKAKLHRGAAVAGPVVRRSMERALTYLGTPASPAMSEEVRRREGN